MNLTDSDPMDDALKAMAEKNGGPGWVYRDLGNMLLEYWDRIMAAAGEGEYKILIYSDRTWPDGMKTRRGQVLFSPTAVEGINRLADEVKAERLHAKEEQR